MSGSAASGTPASDAPTSCDALASVPLPSPSTATSLQPRASASSRPLPNSSKATGRTAPSPSIWQNTQMSW